MSNKIVEPKFGESAFTCPHCNVFTSQEWIKSLHLRKTHPDIKTIAFSLCFNCKQLAIWLENPNSFEIDTSIFAGTTPTGIDNSFIEQYGSMASYGKLIYPEPSTVPLPNDDMPENIKFDYMEARSIVYKSPRGASALLRLCVQKLMPHLGQSGKYIDSDIKELVKSGELSPKIQKSLDILRVTGNESVHPGEMAMEEDIDTALKLFTVLNLIIQETITNPKEIDEMFNNLPQSKREGIEQRDKK